jgi:hypothetical protein
MPIVLAYSALMALLGWLALLVSAVLLVTFARDGSLAGKSLAIHVCWFVAAAGLQFFGASAGTSAAGRLLQTILAVYLILRWKFSSI